MNLFATTLAALAITVCSLSMATELQPFEAGTRPIRERLAVVKKEALALRQALTAAERTEAENAEMAQRLAALEREEKEITAELESETQRFRSPFITHVSPASEPQ